MVHFTLRSLVSSLVMMMMMMMFFSSHASSHAFNKVVDVDTICQKTQNPSFCSNLLNSKPGGAIGANLDTLMQYTFDVIHGNVTNTIDLIGQLINETGNKDVSAKYHYGHCFGRFIGARSDIEYAQNLSKSKDYCYKVAVLLYDVSFSTENCLAFPPHYSDPSMLPKYVAVVEQVNQINSVILGLLRR